MNVMKEDWSKRAIQKRCRIFSKPT